MRAFPSCLLAILLAGGTRADSGVLPAARAHVRYVDGIPMRHTSKLSHVVEMNFTYGFDHSAGKAAIDQILGRIASDYGQGPESAFTVKKFVGPGNGASNGSPNPIFTLDDLQAADVIVANNVSWFDALPSKNADAAAAFETAVRGGKSVLSFHGSAELFGGWRFLAEEVMPLKFQFHSNRVPAPVYRNDAEEKHVVLQGILDSGITRMEVPMGIDSEGNEILKPDVPTRNVLNEMFALAMNPLADARYAPLSTCLLRYDPRAVSRSILPSQYVYKGGNAFACILKAGAGKSAYFPGGHDMTELAQGKTSFDGGFGDFERFFAQMLFFLAGYRSEPCGGSVDCSGLPIVDARDHLTGEQYGTVPTLIEKGKPGFAVPPGTPYRTELLDMRGRVLASRSGRGGEARPFAGRVGPGLYLLRIRIGSAPPRTVRYLIPPAP